MDPKQFRPIAIAVPAETAVRQFAMTKGLAIPDTSLELLVKDSRVIMAVFGELLSVAKRAGLTRMEWIQGLVLVEEEWTPENVRFECRRG